MTEVHEQRQAAEGFGAQADRYDRARPRYPAGLITRIAEAAPGRDLLDVGIGTGIAARQFAEAGCRVHGIDVDPRMADVARRHGFAVDVTKFEDWDPQGRVFDAVVAAQTWHWIDPRAGARKAADALRPGGRWAAFWNAGQPAPEAGALFADVLRRVLPEAPSLPEGMTAVDAYTQMVQTAVTGIRSTEAFGEPEQWHFTWDRDYTRDEWLDQVPTQGIFTSLPADRLAPLLAGLGDGIDALGGGFTMHYTAIVVTCRLDRPAHPGSPG